MELSNLVQVKLLGLFGILVERCPDKNYKLYEEIQIVL